MARIRSIKPELLQFNPAADGQVPFKKKTIPAALRRELARRYGCERGASVKAKCAYCDFVGGVHWIVQPTDRGPGWVAFEDLEIDHVIPEFQGGEAVAENLTLACLPCNRSKGVKRKEEWEHA